VVFPVKRKDKLEGRGSLAFYVFPVSSNQLGRLQSLERRRILPTIERMIVKPFPPFDFNLSAKIFSAGDRQIRKYQDAKFWQVIRIDCKSILIIVEALGTVDEPKLSIELKSNGRISEADKQKAEETVCAIFNLNLDLRPFYEEVKNDKIMEGLTRELRGLKCPAILTVFEALIDSSVEQQISLKLANEMERRLIKAFGDTLNLDNEIYLCVSNTARIRLCKR
jgi:DNA-3-methyladenine glycosylase II